MIIIVFEKKTRGITKKRSESSLLPENADSNQKNGLSRHFYRKTLTQIKKTVWVVTFTEKRWLKSKKRFESARFLIN